MTINARIGIGTLAVAALILGSISLAQRGAPQVPEQHWEYAVLIEGSDVDPTIWRSPDTYDRDTAAQVIRRLGGDPRGLTSYEAVNAAARRGWELIVVEHGAYWFRRPMGHEDPSKTQLPRNRGRGGR